jgi:diguanylate cyclase (GGDEF)-like protein
MDRERADNASADDDRGEADQSSQRRDALAEDRDLIAEGHDRESEARDERAEARDGRATARDEVGAEDTRAAADRVAARGDRAGGAMDRTQAAGDRAAASADRAFSAAEIALFSVDELTGARRRKVGWVELEREIVRAKRTRQPFTLAFVDVDGLKARNDALGHAAGDRLLREIADAIRSHLRPYDLIVRLGGDEFLCGIIDVTKAQATTRFARVSADLAGLREQASITVGLAELAADDALGDLVARADKAMYAQRR